MWTGPSATARPNSCPSRPANQPERIARHQKTQKPATKGGFLCFGCGGTISTIAYTGFNFRPTLGKYTLKSKADVPMSVFGSEADINSLRRHFRFVPYPDIRNRSNLPFYNCRTIQTKSRSIHLLTRCDQAGSYGRDGKAEH